MAYDQYRGQQQPYEQPPPAQQHQQQQQPPPPFNQNVGNGPTTGEPFGNPPPPMQNNFFQPPYPEHSYEQDPQLVTPSSQQSQPPPPPLYTQAPAAPLPQPQLSAPPPPVLPIPAQYPMNPMPEPDPARFYQTGPIDRAVASALPQQPASGPPVLDGPAPPYVSPEIIAQITSTVIQQLRNTGLNPVPISPLQQQHPQHPPSQQKQHPPPPPPQPFDMPPFQNAASIQSDYSPSGAQRRVYTPPSPYKPTDEQQYSSPPMGGSQVSYSSVSRLNTRASPEQPSSPYGRVDRPGGLSRRPTSWDETTIEKVWGQLFDRDGKPTHRMSQFLRGIAVHLIENYPPGNTLVVTPEKMQKYYEDTKVAGDTYPWNDIFDDRTSNISRLYREIQAAHHLVQERLEEKPDIPGLTPHGFERWMTLMIQAYPDHTFERLQRTVREMPINNPDERRERFPKELSRRGFPKSSDNAVREQLERGIITHCKIRPSELGVRNPLQSGRSSSRYRSSSNAEPLTIATSAPSPIPFDHKRIPFSPTVRDEPDGPPARPLERERQPYAVQPTGGKVYNPNSSGSRVTSPIPVNFRDQMDWPRNTSKDDGSYQDAVEDLDERPFYGSSPVTKEEPDARRYRESDRDKVRIDDRDRIDQLYSKPRDQSRERDRRRHHTRPSRGSRDIDEEFYRPSGLLGGRGNSPDPYEDNTWAGRY